MSEKQNNGETPPKNRHCCFNCIFLCLQGIDSVIGKNKQKAIQEYRQKAWEHNTLRRDTWNNTLTCYKDIWDGDVYHINKNIIARDILCKNRGETCFFYPHTECISFPAAEILERRTADRREAEKDRKLTRRNANSARNTAIAAIIVAAVSVVVTIVSIFNKPEEPQKRHVVIDNEISVKRSVEAEKQVEKKIAGKPSPTTSRAMPSP